MCIICDRLLSLQSQCINSLRKNTTHTRLIIKFSKRLTELKLSLPKISDEIKLVSVVHEEKIT